jgi:hypothetical protein
MTELIFNLFFGGQLFAIEHGECDCPWDYRESDNKDD